MRRIAFFTVHIANPSFFVRAENQARARAWLPFYLHLRTMVPQ